MCIAVHCGRLCNITENEVYPMAFKPFFLQAVELVDDDGSEREQPVVIDHENFYDGRVFGEMRSRATVHMEVSMKTNYGSLKTMILLF